MIPKVNKFLEDKDYVPNSVVLLKTCNKRWILDNLYYEFRENGFVIQGNYGKNTVEFYPWNCFETETRNIKGFTGKEQIAIDLKEDFWIKFGRGKGVRSIQKFIPITFDNQKDREKIIDILNQKLGSNTTLLNTNKYTTIVDKELEKKKNIVHLLYMSILIIGIGIYGHINEQFAGSLRGMHVRGFYRTDNPFLFNMIVGIIILAGILLFIQFLIELKKNKK